ncbi:MAG: nuclear transport factor 2 family protein [Gaiella sp.]
MGGDPGSDGAAAGREWVLARAAGDLRRVADLTAPDAVWESPVDGPQHGREAVLDEVAAAFDQTDWFASELLSYDARGDTCVAVIRNRARREGAVLDSLQTLFLRLDQGRVVHVRIAVDDPEAVDAFWAR